MRREGLSGYIQIAAAASLVRDDVCDTDLDGGITS